MRRGLQSLILVIVVVLLPVYWVFRPPVALPARFAADDCRRVLLTDTDTGKPLIGVEDMAPVPGGDRVILSAMDRLAYDSDPARAPQGGLYEVSLARITAGDQWAAPIVYPSQVGNGLFPVGVAVSDDGRRLAFVNRRRDGTVEIVGGRLSPGNFDVTARRADPELCRANDLDFAGDEGMALRVTLDRESCTVSWGDLKPGAATGRVVALDLNGQGEPMTEMAGLAFANGIAGMYVAETRADRLAHRLDIPVNLPGGPDNLTYDPFGNVIVAVHPSLMRIAAYRYGYRGDAPSRIVRVGQDRAVEVLFDDTSGRLFSGASVAVFEDGVLMAGSVHDAGVLICRKAAE